MKTQGIHYHRRSFLGHLACGAVAAGTMPALAFGPTSPKPKTLMLNTVTLADFLPHLNSTFCLYTGSDRIDIKLVETRAIRTSSANRPAGLSEREPFSLLFSVQAKTSLSQQIYRLSHPELGELEIFLVPVGIDASGLKLEAIFN